MLLDLDPRTGETRTPRILVAGVGTAGCMAITRWRTRHDGVRDLPDTFAVHTEAAALESARADRTFQLGAALHQGRGTGGDAQAGHLAATEAADELSRVFSGYDLVFFLAGFGGGTGGGATPELVRLARGLDVLTISMVTLPFMFEGDHRRQQADRALASLKELGDTVVVHPMQRLFDELEPGTKLNQALEQGVARLTDGLRSLWMLLQEPGALPLTLEDVRQLTTHSAGLCTFAHFTLPLSLEPGAMADRIAGSPLLANGASLAKAKGLLLGIRGGGELPVATVNGLLTQLVHACAPGAQTYWGVLSEAGDTQELDVVVLVSEEWVPVTAAVKPPVDAELTVPDEAQEPRDAGQAELPLMARDMTGKFKDSDPTIINGEDLDIPTFVRRNIRLSGRR